jgi:hypothetical protein
MKYYIVLDSTFGDFKYANVEKYKIVNISKHPKYRCLTCGKANSFLEWLPPYILKASKKKLADFLYGVDPFIVTEDVKNKYEKSDLTGLTNFRKVDVYYRSKPIDVQYYLPDIAYEQYLVDINNLTQEEKDFDLKEICPSCQRYRGNAWYKRINGIKFIHPEKIDKDIFCLPLTADIIVSERFKEFSEEHGLSNFTLFEAEKYKWHLFNTVNYANGRAFYDPDYMHPNYKEPDDMFPDVDATLLNKS